MADRVEVVRGSGEKAGPGQPYGGLTVFDVPGAHVGLTRLGPGAATPWHHHGACNFFGFVIQGEVTLEFGPGGRETERVREGHFLRIPPHLVHRDVNETSSDALVATACVGEPPRSVVVDGPDS